MWETLIWSYSWWPHEEEETHQENSASRTQWTAWNFYSLLHLRLWGSRGGQSRNLGEAEPPYRTTDPCGSCHGSECPSWHTPLTAVPAGGKAAYMDLCMPHSLGVQGGWQWKPLSSSCNDSVLRMFPLECQFSNGKDSTKQRYCGVMESWSWKLSWNKYIYDVIKMGFV